jgi:HAD superfamily hydrolase (TIGR01509 family)
VAPGGEAAYIAAMPPVTAPPPRLQPFSAVIFDMDGTLLDTELVFKDIVFEVADGLGFEMTVDVHGRMVGSSHEATNQLLVETYGASFPYALFDAECRRLMRARMAEAVPVKAGVPEILRELKARRIPVAVATSSRSAHALGHLGAAGLLDMFQAIVTRDDVTRPKPHPEPYLTAARHLGVVPDTCLAIEDSRSGVMAAHGAGMQTVMVPDLVPPSEDIRALCTIMASLHVVREAAFGVTD